ncbi:MAG TPA: hypothetical protein VK178_01365 [Opitutaceae bacterium]|nr:hypothetical protein [Opitutaceae bacterium]
MNSTPFRHPRLIALATELDTATPAAVYAPTAELWQTAGIFVTDDALALSYSSAAQHGDLGILTRHARLLSWLFFELRADSRLTGGPWAEREFFGRLADAANSFLAAHQPEESDARPLLLAVLREAGEILRERFARLEAQRRPTIRRAARRRPAFSGFPTLGLVAA